MKSKISVLKSSLSGDLLDGHFDRGRYSTDASIYQIMPEAVVLPKTVEDIQKTIQFSQENSIPILPRGGGLHRMDRLLIKQLFWITVGI